MKTLKWYMIIVLALTLLGVTLSCGGTSDVGPEGSWGVWETNTRVYPSMYPDSLTVDICNSSPSALVANIATEVVSDSVPAYQMYMEGYSLSFEPQDAASPPIAGGDSLLTVYLPEDNLPMAFMDTARKYAFLRELNSGAYSSSPAYPQYTASYTIYGSDINDSTPKLWGTTATFSFMVGKYSPCVPVITPAVANVVAKKNPDGYAGDDITFQVTGGTAPFNIFSDSALISVPGVLNTGQFDFLTDPTTGALPATVQISVIDALGETSSATVYLH